jgi:pilus assembly protein CpaB
MLFVALTMGGIAAYLAKTWLQSHSVDAAVVEKGTIVVANGPLSFGAPITTDDVREIAWPTDTVPDGAFSSVQDLVKDGRRLVLSPFVRDEPIVASKISAPNARASLSTVIEEGMRAVTVSVDDVRGVAGFIYPGDYVDVVLTGTGGAQNYSEVVLQHVKVLAIDQIAGQRQERPTVARAVTVEVTQEQALKILLAANIGRLSLILRQSAEVAMAPQARVTDRDLYNEGSQASAPSPVIVAGPAAPPESDTRKVTVVRSMRSEDYDVPKDLR